VRLTVQLFASLRERAGRETLFLEDAPAAMDVAGLKKLLEERHPELGRLVAVRGVVGTTYVPEDTRLRDGDTVALLPPVSGGRG
jgi:molybdopterin converting factor small subunit